MADSFVPVPGSGPVKVDVEGLVVGANTVERQRVQLAGAAPLEIARVINTNPVGNEFGVVVRPLGVLTTQASSRKAIETTRYDLAVTNANLYVGVASVGSASSAAVWTIYRTTMVLGSPTITEQTSSTAVWDNRVTETYL